MNIVYNSQHYYLVEYPVRGGFELVDKDSGRGTFLQGSVAAQFRQSLQEAVDINPDVEAIDEFLGEFDEWLDQPVVYH